MCNRDVHAPLPAFLLDSRFIVWKSTTSLWHDCLAYDKRWPPVTGGALPVDRDVRAGGEAPGLQHLGFTEGCRDSGLHTGQHLCDVSSCPPDNIRRRRDTLPQHAAELRCMRRKQDPRHLIIRKPKHVGRGNSVVVGPTSVRFDLDGLDHDSQTIVGTISCPEGRLFSPRPISTCRAEVTQHDRCPGHTQN